MTRSKERHLQAELEELKLQLAAYRRVLDLLFENMQRLAAMAVEVKK